MNHKELDIWKESIELTKKIYLITKDFPKEETYGLTSQIRRACVSIPSNISEGSARNHDNEFIQFLYISLGSLAELDTQLIIAKEIGYTELIFDEDITKIRKKILGLIKYLKNK
jgi:four helix bundle protein